MEKNYQPNTNKKQYVKYSKPKIIKIEKNLPPVTVNFAPPAVESLENKVRTI